jgi:hypothetical protein
MHYRSLTPRPAYINLRSMRTSTKHSPVMRVMAAVVLLCWSVALAVCWNHCASGTCESGQATAPDAQPSCHATTDTEDPGSDSSDAAGNACFAKKPFAGERDSSALSAPLLSLAFLASNPAEILYELAVPPQTAPVRQPGSSDWVFTPEVSLGPAFRSLAPPAFI